MKQLKLSFSLNKTHRFIQFNLAGNIYEQVNTYSYFKSNFKDIFSVEFRWCAA